MRNPELDNEGMAQRRERMLGTAFHLFTERNIASVTMAEIAKQAGCGNKTLHRYFETKTGLVIEVAVWRWNQFKIENRNRRSNNIDFEGFKACDIFEFYLDSFIELYRKHKDLLQFNQLFNIYLRSAPAEANIMRPYGDMIAGIAQQFHMIYEKAESDKTLRLDESEQEMFSTTLHIMLAAVTRYAVGLVYKPEGFNPEKELNALKEAMMLRYRA